MEDTEILEVVESAACGFTPEMALLLEEFMMFFTAALMVAGLVFVFKIVYRFFRIFF